MIRAARELHHRVRLLDVNLRQPRLTESNGKIQSQTDGISGETVTYTYDALNRLATAENQSTFSPSWGQSFSYDGFGNLTNTNVIQGSAPSMAATYDANNHAGGEDANGNPGYVPAPAQGTSVPGAYDVENRVATLGSACAVACYSYDPANKRVWRGSWNYNGEGAWTRATDEIAFWSVSGRKLATYNVTQSGSTLYCTQSGMNLYFGGKLIKDNNGWVYSDRLGSIGKFYPYGIERPSATTNGTEKFTGYFRDSETGNDYAVNRYESPGTGRFLTPDRSARANPRDPGSWNRYAYTRGDPINRVDPNGTDDCNIEGPQDCYCQIYGDPNSPYGYDPNCDPNYCPEGVCAPNGQRGGQRVFQPPAPVEMSASQEGMIFSAALGEADYLLTKPNCASLFPGVSAISVLNSLASGTQANPSQYGFIQWVSFNASVNYYEATTTYFPAIQQDVVLLNGNVNGELSLDWQSGGAIDVALVLIHELGHVIYDQFGSAASQIGPDSDAIDPTGLLSAENTGRVIQNCDPPGGPPSGPGQN